MVHEPYRGVKLSEKGLMIAMKVVRKHRLAERLLTDVLDLDWADVHEVACQLEHAIPDEILPFLEKALKFPKTCPHGNAIATEIGEILEGKVKPLTRLEPDKSAKVVKIVDENKGLLQRLAACRLKPNVAVRMLEKNFQKGLLKIKTTESTCVLEFDVASVIWVREASEVGE